MPASIAHMLIFGDAIAKIEEDKSFEELIKALRDNIKYGRLGSVGPDLPYYGPINGGIFPGIAKLALLASDLPSGIELWSHQMHAKDPNVFPLKMIEIAWRETDLDANEWDEISIKQWAYISGFLTHIAADQIVHPYVNKIAGQYYRGPQHMQDHRDCEVYHDVVLLDRKKGKNIHNADLMEWTLVTSKYNVEPFLRIFLQKAFIEAHAVCPSENDIENWVFGHSTVLKGLGVFGPYKNATKAYQTEGENSGKYKKFWLNNGGRPYEQYYNEAVELAAIYIKAAYQLFKINRDDFGDTQREVFKSIIQNADLTNPLEKDILGQATKSYAKI